MLYGYNVLGKLMDARLKVHVLFKSMTYTISVWGETIDVPGWLSDEASGSLDTLLDLAVLLSELGKSIPCTGMTYAPHLEILNNWKQMENKGTV